MKEILISQAEQILESSVSTEDKIDRLLTIGLDYEWIIKTIFDFTN